MASLFRPRYQDKDKSGNKISDSKGNPVYRESEIWWVQYRLNGKTHRESTKTRSKSQAKKIMTDIQARINDGRMQFAVKRDKTLEDFLPEFLNKLKLTCRKRTIYRYNEVNQRFLRYLQDTGKATVLVQISTRDIEEYLNFRLEKVSKRTADTECKCVARMFNVAVKYKYLVVNPCDDVEKIKYPEREMKFFTREQAAKMIENAGYFEPHIKFLLLTGVRSGEFGNMRWGDIDFKNDLVHVRNREDEGFVTKSQKQRKIELNRELKESLTEYKASRTDTKDNDVVFLNKAGLPFKGPRLYKIFTDILVKAGLKDKKEGRGGFNVHSCRHTFISWLVMAGVDLRTVQALAGHHSLSETEKYAHLAPEHLKNSVNRLSLETEDSEEKRILNLKSS